MMDVNKMSGTIQEGGEKGGPRKGRGNIRRLALLGT